MDPVSKPIYCDGHKARIQCPVHKTLKDTGQLLRLLSANMAPGFKGTSLNPNVFQGYRTKSLCPVNLLAFLGTLLGPLTQELTLFFRGTKAARLAPRPLPLQVQVDQDLPS